jgi:hypothetical protein
VTYSGNHGVAVRTGNQPMLCHSCKEEIQKGERYVKSNWSYHTLHFRDARGKPIYEPITDLELSRASIPLVTVSVRGVRNR